jgi:ribonuclease P protein subunit RPR2
MIRIARERIADLFGLAEAESRRGPSGLPDRYVRLARRVGTRYNVRLVPEYRQLYCRGCSAYWVEGRTVRTRLRGGHRTQTCLQCGRVRRAPIRSGKARAVGDPLERPSVGASEPVPVSDEAEDGMDGDEGEEE